MSEARAPTLASFLMTWHRTSTHALTQVLVATLYIVHPCYYHGYYHATVLYI